VFFVIGGLGRGRALAAVNERPFNLPKALCDDKDSPCTMPILMNLYTNLQERPMRLHRPRLTIRWMMLVVAIIAILLSMNIFHRRSQKFAQISNEFALKENYAVEWKGSHPDPDPPNFEHWINTKNGSLQVKPKNYAYYSEMKIKYDRLSNYPWFFVPADPPEPK
jgi:hypothetical protein